MTDMYGQREQLLNAQKKVKETHTMAGDAKQILSSMAWRAFTNKLCLYFVILVLIGANCGLAYYGLTKGKKDKGNGNSNPP